MALCLTFLQRQQITITSTWTTCPITAPSMKTCTSFNAPHFYLFRSIISWKNTLQICRQCIYFGSQAQKRRDLVGKGRGLFNNIGLRYRYTFLYCIVFTCKLPVGQERVKLLFGVLCVFLSYREQCGFREDKSIRVLCLFFGWERQWFFYDWLHC